MATVENGRVTEVRLHTASRVREGQVAIASGPWRSILGTLSYDAIPSPGPFHGAPGEFAGLPYTMTQDTQSRNPAGRAHHLVHPQEPDALAPVSPAVVGEAS
jgi:hypothetical protein